MSSGPTKTQTENPRRTAEPTRSALRTRDNSAVWMMWPNTQMSSRGTLAQGSTTLITSRDARCRIVRVATVCVAIRLDASAVHEREQAGPASHREGSGSLAHVQRAIALRPFICLYALQLLWLEACECYRPDERLGGHREHVLFAAVCSMHRLELGLRRHDALERVGSAQFGG